MESHSDGSIACARTNLGEPPAALALSHDGARLVVAGRELLKQFELRPPQPHSTTTPQTNQPTPRPTPQHNIDNETNLLAHTRKNVSLSSADVAYVPELPTQIVTGSLDGTLLLWDTHRRGSKLVRKYDAHSRAVNSLAFQPGETRLLSASQDQTVKLWDIGARNAAQLRFVAAAEVRDVQFCRGSPSRFVAALESGSVQLFDLRSSRGCVAQWHAHYGPVYALDHHPHHRGLLATGGRDRNIKVWDLDGRGGGSLGAVAEPLHSNVQLCSSIQTVAPVARLRWRPTGGGASSSYQIASSGAALHRCKVHVWDALHPALPVYATARDHADAVVGFEFLPPVGGSGADGPRIVAASRDGALALHQLSGQPQPYLNVSPVCISWGRGGRLMAAHSPHLVELRDGIEPSRMAATSQRRGQPPSHSSVPPPLLPGVDTFTCGGGIAVAPAEPSREEEKSAGSSSARLTLLHALHSVATVTPLDAPGQAEVGQPVRRPMSTTRGARTPRWARAAPSPRQRASTAAALEAAGSRLTLEAAAATEARAAALGSAANNKGGAEPPMLVLLPVLRDAVHYYTELGDVLSCMVISRALDGGGELAAAATKLRWLVAYVEQNHREQHYASAAAAIKEFGAVDAATRETARQLTSRSTVHVRRQGDRRELGGVRSLCSVCQLPVKGLYMWCQGCGHGGHDTCLRKWFARSVQCPFGCGHCCLSSRSALVGTAGALARRREAGAIEEARATGATARLAREIRYVDRPVVEPR